MKNWDYSSPGSYFITICTHNHNNHFGKIIGGQTVLSKIGENAKYCLNEIPKHFNNVIIDSWAIMPNHIHILFQLLPSTITTCRDVACNVSTNIYNVSTHNKNQYFSNISPKKNSISSIVRSFKSAVKNHANQFNLWFSWQPRFFDEIVTDPIRLQIIRNYIINNPKNWHKDKLFK